MTHFEIDPARVAEIRERAAGRAAAGEGPELATQLRSGEGLDAEALAALYLAKQVDAEALLLLAKGLRADDSHQLETFSPLYISNECDAECVMCGMRRVNAKLQRETASAAAVREQLDILHQRGLRGVALLTGEYQHGERRQRMLAQTAATLRDAVRRGFQHVLINVGSLEAEEYPELLAGIERCDDGVVGPQLTMCTFQETYDPSVYERFMGSNPENPRGDFKRRLENFDRAADAGMRFANPGLLLGLNRDVVYELIALVAHVEHLVARGMTVYVSLPRLRKASGAPRRAGVSDDELVRLVSLLSAGVPEARVVISTREAPEIQQRLLPIIAVLTAGSPGVAPYTEVGARFELEASQFEVADQRPMETILEECMAAGSVIDGYVPAASRPGPGPGPRAATP